MDGVNPREVRAMAEAELQRDNFHEAVAKEKEKLKRKRPLMDILFPWKITITRKDKKQ